MPTAVWAAALRAAFYLQIAGLFHPIREIPPQDGTHKSVEGRWTHHVRCFFVPLTHRPDVCGWFGCWGRLGLRHLGGWLVSARREQSGSGGGSSSGSSGSSDSSSVIGSSSGSGYDCSGAASGRESGSGLGTGGQRGSEWSRLSQRAGEELDVLSSHEGGRLHTKETNTSL